MDVGEIARNLYRLYDYMLRRLVEANIKSDRARVEEVLKYLEELRDAWSQAIANLRREKMVAEAEPALQSLSITG
jgi:flagellar protein FliS